MNCIIPFTKEIKFKTNISEILSISLEHDYTINDNELLGNFIITGDYKTHEVSVNKDTFEHVLPFSVALTTRIDPESLDFNIEDFTYEVIENNTLKVDIEYSVKATEEPDEPIVFERLESESEESVEDLLEEFESEVEEVEEKTNQAEREEKIEIKVEETEKEVEVEEKKKEMEMVVETIPDQLDEIMDEEKEKVKEKEEEKEREITEAEKETILNNLNNDDNTFVTYHIHVLKERETIETVCTMYNTNSALLGEYNDITNISTGDKLIIPDMDE